MQCTLLAPQTQDQNQVLMKRYSFIIPHKNALGLLSRCLDSIPRRQDVEIIVVDDNSRPAERPVPGDPSVRIVQLEPDQSRGAGRARNTGLECAEGKWLLFADCDDYYEEGFLDVLDRYAEEDADIVYFDAYYDSGKPDLKIGSIWQESLERYRGSAGTRTDQLRLQMSTNQPWNKMFRREFVLSADVRFEEIPICNDAYFSMRLAAETTNVRILGDKLYHYVANGQGITFSKRPLSDYRAEIDANIRLNRMRYRLGLADTICLPGFNLPVVERDYGKAAAVRLYAYKIFHDPTFLPVFFYHVFRKLKNLFAR